MTNELEHLFMCFLAIYIFEERSSQIFTEFSNWVICLLIAGFVRVLSVFWTQVPYPVCPCLLHWKTGLWGHQSSPATMWPRFPQPWPRTCTEHKPVDEGSALFLHSCSGAGIASLFGTNWVDFPRGNIWCPPPCRFLRDLPWGSVSFLQKGPCEETAVGDSLVGNLQSFPSRL